LPQTPARIAAYRNLSNRLCTHGRFLRQPSPDLDATGSPTGPSPTATFASAGTTAVTTAASTSSTARGLYHKFIK
jgi:hypothetical protein